MRTIKTKLTEIADYWIQNNNIDDNYLNFNWHQCLTHCWNCGDNKENKRLKTIRLERCHIIPHSLKGLDTPSNYVLLCKTCHADAPNTLNKYDMWDWIKSNRTFFGMTNTYRFDQACKELKRIKGIDFIEEIKTLKNYNFIFEDILKVEEKKVSKHFGWTINVSTYALLLNQCLTQMKQQ